MEIVGEAEVQTERTAQYTIIHSNFSMWVLYANYSTVKLCCKKQFQSLSLQVTHLITLGRNVTGQSPTWKSDITSLAFKISLCCVLRPLSTWRFTNNTSQGQEPLSQHVREFLEQQHTRNKMAPLNDSINSFTLHADISLQIEHVFLTHQLQPLLTGWSSHRSTSYATP